MNAGINAGRPAAVRGFERTARDRVTDGLAKSVSSQTNHSGSDQDNQGNLQWEKGKKADMPGLPAGLVAHQTYLEA
jgi:hypothetical protein